MSLTPLGIVHTLISLVAVAAGLMELYKYRHIQWGNAVGKVYVVATVLTCLTGFGIFQHGGFGKPHVLGVLTLLVLAIAVGTELRGWFGSKAGYVSTVAYSMTFLFHWIPGITETTTRLPVGLPIFESPEAFGLQVIAVVLFVLYLLGAAWQIVDLRGAAMAAGDDEEEMPLPR